jgi:hypothetical protein
VQSASTVVMVDLVPGTRAYCDRYAEAPPILVISTGGTEVQLGIPGRVVTVEDVANIDAILEAGATCRADLIARLG